MRTSEDAGSRVTGQRPGHSPIGWILLLAGSGFALSFLGAGMARLTRDAVLPAYLVIVGTLLLVYVRSTGVPLRDYLIPRWRIGLVAGLALGALLTLMCWLSLPRLGHQASTSFGLFSGWGCCMVSWTPCC